MVILVIIIVILVFDKRRIQKCLILYCNKSKGDTYACMQLHTLSNILLYIFYRASAELAVQSPVLDTVELSVHLSFRLSVTCWH